MPVKILLTAYLTASAILLCSCGGILETPIKEILLNDNWLVKSENDSIGFNTEIPNEIHSDLLKNKTIPHPFWGDNEKQIQWVAEKNWVYEKHFDVDSSLLAKENLEVVFEGIDAYSDIYLNNIKILTTNNQFRQWKTDVKSIIRPSNNKLKVIIYSPFEIEEKKARLYGFQPPGDSRIFTRKAAYVYGWDWGPRIVTSGIWKKVKLEGWNGPRLKDAFIIQDSLKENKAYLKAQFEILSDKQEEIALEVNGLKNEVDLKEGRQTFEICFELDNPELWWPNGLGDQKLYKIDCSLIHKDFGVQTISKKIGLRTIELVRERDSTGKSFYFKVNGIPVFMKGANYIPMQILSNDADTNKYGRLINDVAESNMNMLRVWGGGIYENEIFYDLCDEKGILVWQDFMFANGIYPADSLMLENISIEAEEQIKRLRNHPSTALFCGNNEIAEAWTNWGWKNNYTADQQNRIRNDYDRIFHNLLPDLVKAYAPQIPYWPSSPQFGRGDERSLSEGDSHYWGIWHDSEPFELFEQRVPRFMSEFGFQSYPSLKTLSRWLDEVDVRLDAPKLQNHQKHPGGDKLIKEYMTRDYCIPRDMSLFVYISQLLQAEGVLKGIEAHRRAKPYCMGSLYWQLNDCWPAVSWSGIDYDGRWKALQYFVRKSFAQVIISVEREDSLLHIFVVNDRQDELNGKLIIRGLNFNGQVIFEKKIDRVIKSAISEKVLELNLKQLPDHNPGETVIKIQYCSDNNIIAEKNYYLVRSKELLLTEPQISLLIEDEKDHRKITISSDVLAKNVFIENRINGNFSDNFFDLMPGEEKTILFYPKEKRDSETEYSVRSLWNALNAPRAEI